MYIHCKLLFFFLCQDGKWKRYIFFSSSLEDDIKVLSETQLYYVKTLMAKLAFFNIANIPVSLLFSRLISRCKVNLNYPICSINLLSIGIRSYHLSRVEVNIYRKCIYQKVHIISELFFVDISELNNAEGIFTHISISQQNTGMGRRGPNRMQSTFITTNVVRSNPAHGEVYTIWSVSVTDGRSVISSRYSGFLHQ